MNKTGQSFVKSSYCPKHENLSRNNETNIYNNSSSRSISTGVHKKEFISEVMEYLRTVWQN